MATNKNNQFNLKLLPDLVKLHLCGFLNTGSLLNLRRTCKDIQAVVDQPSVIQRLPIKITCSKQLQRVLESTVKFNSFILSFKYLDEQTYFTQFTDQFGSSIRNLVITSCGGHLKILYLLQKCNQLKELELKMLDVDTVKSNSAIFDAVVKNLKNLRKLVIHDCKGVSFKGVAEIETFFQVLNGCPSLTYLKVPGIPSYNQKIVNSLSPQHPRNENDVHAPAVIDDMFEEWEGFEVDQPAIEDDFPNWDYNGHKRDILIHGIIDYIKERNSNPSRLRYLDVGSVSLFGWKALSDLLEICQQNQIELLDIRSTQFIHLNHDLSKINTTLYDAIKSVRVTQIYEGFPFFDMIGIRTLTFSIFPGVCSGVDSHDTLLLPHLENLTVKFMLSGNEPQAQLIINKIFKEYQRKSVKTLQLEWDLLGPSCQTIGALDLVNNFKYLRGLTIYKWSGSDKDFCMLWENLLDLEKLTIKDCKNITNKAFLGSDYIPDFSKKPLNLLKKLYSLTIRDITGNINDAAFLGSFRWLKLYHFEFQSTVTTTMRCRMYQELANAPLAETVEYLFIPPPRVEGVLPEKTIERSFKNLKHRLFY